MIPAPALVIIQRWDQAIADVRARFEQLLQEAWQASEPLVAATELDFGPLTRAWGAVEHRMKQHASEISDRWDQVSDELSEVENLPEDLMRHEGQKRDAAGDELEIRYTQFLRAIMARAAEIMRQRALAEDARLLACTQCGAALDRVTAVSHARDVACGHCQAVNTVEPGAALRMFAASGAMALAEQVAIGSWETMKRTEAQIDAYRERKAVPLPLLAAYETAARQYWTTRLEVEASFVPEQQSYVAPRLARHMQDTEKKLRQFWQWRQRTA